MPRRKLARRFDPRFGVTESMVEAEALHIGQEFRDYLLLSVSDLKERLQKVQIKIATADANLEFTISRLPDRERLAMRCMLARDFFHIAALYERFLKTVEAAGSCEPVEEELAKDGEPAAVVPFSEWLFNPK